MRIGSENRRSTCNGIPDSLGTQGAYWYDKCATPKRSLAPIPRRSIILITATFRELRYRFIGW